MRILGRFLLAAGAAVSVLMIGVLAAIVLGGFALLERSGPVSNGFLVLEFVAIGVLICTPMSIAAACWVLFRSGRVSKELIHDRGGLFLGR